MEGSNFNQIAQDYHLKRKKPWRPLEFFLKHLKNKGYDFKGVILDLGCANGRNFKLMSYPPNKLIGIDISLELLKIANLNLNNIVQFSQFESKFIQLLQADIANLPIRRSSIHSIYSIATIHHIKEKSERKSVIVQIYESLKTNGNLILTVWRKWQKIFRNYFFLEWFKRNFSYNYKIRQKNIGLREFGDKFVPWTIPKEEKIYNRFYHFFSKKELKKLLRIFDLVEFKITGGPTNRDNFFIFARKPKN
ncbi:MAG: class I SAM-dependent methyltransferase [Candidatus Hodarchaeota archaeon]